MATVYIPSLLRDLTGGRDTATVEGDYAVASVRYSGLIREAEGANADSFDEIWHVRKKTTDPKSTWLIAGIQQVA